MSKWWFYMTWVYNNNVFIENSCTLVMCFRQIVVGTCTDHISLVQRIGGPCVGRMYLPTAPEVVHDVFFCFSTILSSATSVKSNGHRRRHSMTYFCGLLLPLPVSSTARDECYECYDHPNLNFRLHIFSLAPYK